MTTENEELLGKIFKMVEDSKAAEPPSQKKKKREMTDEQRKRMLDNLRRGREIALRNKRLRKEAATAAEKPKQEKEVVERTTAEKPKQEKKRKRIQYRY